MTKTKTQRTETSQTPWEAYCLENAAYFTACRGRTPRQRTREEFPTLAAAQTYAATFGDGRTMIYAVTAEGRDAHILNA